MRDIEFRAWHIENKSMVFFDYKRIVNDVIQMQHFCELLNGTHNDGVIMQYTGLRDKKGVKIFEGDLIKNERGRTAKVVWHDWTASFDCEFIIDECIDPSIDKSFGFKNHQWPTCTEVIGNIHESPELINQ